MVSISQLMLLNSTTMLKHKFMENSHKAALRVASLPQHGFGSNNAVKLALLQNQQQYNALKTQEVMLQEHRLLQDMKLEHTLERLRNIPVTLNMMA